LYFKRAFFESKLDMIEARDPLAYENDKTPIIIIIDANILSAVFVVATSP
jgi:hypothetical protein